MHIIYGPHSSEHLTHSNYDGNAMADDEVFEMRQMYGDRIKHSRHPKIKIKIDELLSG